MSWREARVWGVLLTFMQREGQEHYGFKTEKVENRRDNALGEIFGVSSRQHDGTLKETGRDPSWKPQVTQGILCVAIFMMTSWLSKIRYKTALN